MRFSYQQSKKGLEALTETLISFVNTGALGNNQTIMLATADMLMR